jgi:hypothetical protein
MSEYVADGGSALRAKVSAGEIHTMRFARLA